MNGVSLPYDQEHQRLVPNNINSNPGRAMGGAGRWVLAAAAAALLAGCASSKYTVDDGRAVNDSLLDSIRAYGAGENAIRGAVARTRKLNDPDCARQWDLPFSVASSDGLSATDRVAWVRALGVDERLTVIGASARSPLQLQDKIVAVAGYTDSSAATMLERLNYKRDSGKSFNVKLASGRIARITPFEVCRGYTELANPATPDLQDYEWQLSVHPLQVVRTPLGEDEALWLVLWTQGVSEMGGGRMKTYHYAVKFAGALYDVASIATGLQGAAVAAQAGVAAAQAAAATATTTVLRGQITSQALAASRSRLVDKYNESARRSQIELAADTMQHAKVNRASLSGISWVASTVFESADIWAYDRMERLKADPLAGMVLHRKLLEQQFADNVMLMDPDRLAAFGKFVRDKGRGDDLDAILLGDHSADVFAFDASMPVASDNPFFYEDMSHPPTARVQPIASFADSLGEGVAQPPEK